jgi:hypothetical protein
VPGAFFRAPLQMLLRRLLCQLQRIEENRLVVFYLQFVEKNQNFKVIGFLFLLQFETGT